MPHQFQRDMEELKTNLVRMASIVDDQVGKAINLIETGDDSSIKDIKAKDDEVDAYDELLQIQCENILALFQPIAFDLRSVISTLMINNQLERCGDISVSISNRASKITQFRNLIDESGIAGMAKEAHTMVSCAIDSFIHSNGELAHQVIKNDKKVDDLNKFSFEFITGKMKSDPQLIEPLAHMLILARQIERLADHATNIAEHLLFLTEAKIVTHRKVLEN
ncbi:MAG: phosphate transport system regulatory protein PhoU [Stygiobacter sp. RIFOXYC12_FULL_38_8]|nr:MAG: phosphate transport system regulatory protein PhoU [Stygiobacter sp. GWC2_38_9]OGU77903.1 MAG: phosphate transport system regulatory protein PhoU [Stygiobacter sp. RIFOXYA12_FULL_38_9]OGV09026.1 MAG: phosphate transport system regulatory protein PhoU [Stygiobacter sp. RIFOXYB2_FULL_37_11]OGV16252.1 MAG: phosphate transport system regulatory protein PhoU [Stygiobacter sp. RIFOXYC2_FULL_38_25]OGV28605.1 MAG: phosphate transport system regulatory protein PhoU [Stygiobacter sp. RIFOXYC12_FU